MKRSLAISALIFCIGIFFASKIRVAFILVYIFALIFMLLASLSLKKGLRFDIFLSCLIFVLAAALWKNAKILPPCHISKFISYNDRRYLTVRGEVISPPISKNNTLSFEFKAEELKLDTFKYNTCGNILVYCRGIKGLHYGDEAHLSGRICRPFGFRGSRRMSYRDYLYNKGIYCVMNARRAVLCNGLKRNKAPSLKRMALRIKEKTEGIIFKRVSPASAGILDAMILGEKRNISPVINNSMMKSGTVHVPAWL